MKSNETSQAPSAREGGPSKISSGKEALVNLVTSFRKNRLQFVMVAIMMSGADQAFSEENTLPSSLPIRYEHYDYERKNCRTESEQYRIDYVDDSNSGIYEFLRDHSDGLSVYSREFYADHLLDNITVKSYERTRRWRECDESEADQYAAESVLPDLKKDLISRGYPDPNVWYSEPENQYVFEPKNGAQVRAYRDMRPTDFDNDSVTRSAQSIADELQRKATTQEFGTNGDYAARPAFPIDDWYAMEQSGWELEVCPFEKGKKKGRRKKVKNWNNCTEEEADKYATERILPEIRKDLISRGYPDPQVWYSVAENQYIFQTGDGKQVRAFRETYPIDLSESRLRHARTVTDQLQREISRSE